MTELTTGKFKITELAEWFGIKVSSLKSTKEKKLEELKEFTEYKIGSSQQNLITKIK